MLNDFKIVKLLDSIQNTVITGGLVPKGAYSATTDYAVGDSVDYNGSSYVMYSDASAGTVPTNTTYWQVLADKGDTGSTGATGATGEGVASGGTTGQMLAKKTNTDYDTEWVSRGSGDMEKSTYDTDDDGRVDKAESVDDGTNVTTAAHVKDSYTHSQVASGNPHSVTLSDVGGTTDHTALSNIGTNTHAQIDTHIASTSNPHSVDKSDVGLGNVPNTDCTNASNITTGTLPSGVLPPVALTTVQVVADEAAQLALTAEEGDVAVRSDENKSYMHNGGSAGDMTDWTELQTPTDTVLSVNGETGTVVLTTGDISEDTDKNYVTDAEATVLGNTSGTNTGDEATATTTASGISELSTNTEANAGTATNRVVTPANLGSWTGNSTILDRANHTGTQAASTISDFDTEVSNNSSVTANTDKVSADGSIKTHSDVYSSMTPSDGQVLTYDTANGWQAEDVTGTGDVVGPSSATDDDIATFDSTTGKLIQDSGVGISDVSANTSARHDAVTVTDSAEVDFTLTGQDITASIKASSIDEAKLDASVNASLDLADSATQPGDLATVATSGDHTDLSNIGTNTHAQIDTHIASTSNPHSVIASQVNVLELGTATYDDVQDWIDTTQSAGKITGGAITDGGSGNASVSAGTGIIKITDSDVGVSKFFDWSANTALALSDGETNYIYVEYNSGTPQVAASTSMPSDKNTNILLGLVHRDGTDLHITSAGMWASNYNKKTFFKDIEINGKFQRQSGMVISETGTRNIATTAGAIYAGLTKVSMSAFDSSGADTFTYYYRDGSGDWTTVASQSQIDNVHYDDGDGTLGSVSTSSGWRTYYGVHWVYMDADGDVFVLYGQGNYLLSAAQNVQPPATIPDLLNDIGGLIGKIIIERDASSFESIESAFDIQFTPSVVSSHNELSGLQGGTADEYYHLEEAEHTDLTDGGDSTLHYHAADRARANHTGTQAASTISDFDTEVSNNTDVTDNTTHRGQTDNPHSVTKTQVGLGNVPNTDCTNASNITTGTLSSGVLPPVALTTVQVVASEVAQLALTAEEGDVAVRSDENKSYMRNDGSAGDMTDWTELQTPTDTVLSVNGETGSVVLTTGDISEDTDKNYVTDAQQTVLGNTSGTNTGDEPNSSTTARGIVELATITETNTGTDAVRAITPAGLAGSALQTKVDGIEAGAEVNNISDANVTDLTDGGDSTLHYHATDRARANHTGTQTASTISDFDTEVSNNTDVTANTAKVSNATHTGEVTGSTTLTIADNIVDEANMKISNAPTDDYVLTADSGATGGWKWASATGSGDVVGPSSAVDDRLVTFDGTTGKLVQDGGKTVSDVLSRANHTGTQTASTISDFDTEVSNNTDVAANTSAKHDAVTLGTNTASALSLSGQVLSLADKFVQISGDTMTGALNVTGDIDATGDISASTNGSSTSSPRVFGYKDLTSGEACRFQFGDEHNGFQNGYAQDVQIYGYWGVVLIGGMQNWSSGFTPPPFTKTTDIGVLVDTIIGDDQVVSLGVRGDSGQTTNLQEWRDSSDTTLASVSIDGDFATKDLAVTGNITVSGTVDGRDLATDGTKLDGIESGADVTDTANVTSAGALMDSEVDADIKTLTLPASTTISTFGASLVDDADAGTARTTLGVDAAGTDNSTDVTIGTNTASALSLSGQELSLADKFVQLAGDTMTGALTMGGNVYMETYSVYNVWDLGINNSIQDTSSNEFISFSKTASAVNEIEITNAATGDAPEIGVSGGDTNIDLILTGKGTGDAFVGVRYYETSRVTTAQSLASSTWTDITSATLSTITVPVASVVRCTLQASVKNTGGGKLAIRFVVNSVNTDVVLWTDHQDLYVPGTCTWTADIAAGTNMTVKAQMYRDHTAGTSYVNQTRLLVEVIGMQT